MLNGKNILITGGTGSFGKKILEMIFERYNPNKVIIYSRDEYKQSVMKSEYGNKVDMSKVRFFIGDVRDKDRLFRAFENVDYVIHAAAMKQVPTCEYNPMEAVKTNIHGAQNVIDAALDRNVKRVVALSTDKAVSDKLFVAANAYSGYKDTRFSVVRYGNVAGSRGSVIPIWKKIIENGGDTLGVTDMRMTRFWITLEQGVELVFKALSESKGGETYISKIPSFHIGDLAKAMLPNCKIDEFGIREGEKLHEVMVTKDDSLTTYEYDKHYIIYPHYNWADSNNILPGGRKVAEGFEYSSGNNTQWLNEDDLRKALNNI